MKVFIRGSNGRAVDVSRLYALPHEAPAAVVPGAQVSPAARSRWLEARRKLGLAAPRVSAPSAQAAPPWGKRR